jgi:plastocyanin
LVASGLKFDRTCIAVPPHRTTTLTLINNDPGQSHNVAIYRSDSCLANAVAAGDASTCSDLTDGLRFKGPVVAHGQATYHILGLRPGNYAFICTVHPTMHGAFKVA